MFALVIQLATLFTSLDPTALDEQLAFYALYPNTEEGQQALKQAAKLIGATPAQAKAIQVSLTDLPNLWLDGELPRLTPNTIAAIESVTLHLPHKRLKGHKVLTTKACLNLKDHEIDIGRGLLLTMTDDPHLIRSFEALLDLMALQILCKVGLDGAPEAKIAQINHLLFHKLHLRFPPQSGWESDIESYTFLPQVLSSKRGVCLGVSTLYLCLSQRIGLPLEPITPPGHIYVRYKEGDAEINIETTARGVHVPTDHYLNLKQSLEPRTLKEVIGLNYMNQGATFWQNKQYDKALTAYQTAYQFLPDDPLCSELLAYNILRAGDKAKAGRLLLNAETSAAADLVDHRCDLSAIETVYAPTDHTRPSLDAKRAALEEVVKQYPTFRAGHLQLALTWLEIGRTKEALPSLLAHHQLDPNDPLVEHLLAQVYFERKDYPASWTHLQAVEALTDPNLPAVAELRRALRLNCPPPAGIE